MKIFTNILILLIIGIANQSFGQQTEIYVVKFNFHHSRRIPDNFVSVDFQRFGDSIKVYVKSIPMDTVSVKWKETRQDYVLGLNLTEFDKIVNAVQKIKCGDISKGLGFSGLDGTTCEIEMGGIGSGITYKVWSPDYETKNRNLQSFLDACTLILQTAKLDPQKIL